MPFEIVNNDLLAMDVDALIIDDHHQPEVSTDFDKDLNLKAGPGLFAARRIIGGIPYGKAVSSAAYNLSSKIVIHAVGPVFDGRDEDKEKLLKDVYYNALFLALSSGCESVAMPLISTSFSNAPGSLSYRIAVETIRHFLDLYDLSIYLVVKDKSDIVYSKSLADEVDDYLSDFLESQREGEYPRILADVVYTTSDAKASYADDIYRPSELEKMLEKLDAGFSESLLKLIDMKGKSDPDVYKKANIDRKLFSKIRSNPEYQPTKSTALALAFGLELSLEETKEFIAKAGYALSESKIADVIVMYFLTNRIHDLYLVNAELLRYDQSPIGGVIRE